MKGWWNVIYLKLKCAAFVLKLEKACGTLIFPLPSCPSYLASGCTYYPWLFCYLYCDVCIIDQNKIYITKNNRKGSDNASYFYFLAGWLQLYLHLRNHFVDVKCWHEYSLGVDRKSKVTNTALDSIGKHMSNLKLQSWVNPNDT
jgi:hypothetical protein